MREKRKRLPLLAILLLVLSLLSPLHALPSQASAPSTDMAVHFIDVGQGLAILVQSGGQNLVYDGGGQSHSQELISYLKKQNVQTIDYMIASHYDEDHIGGLLACMDSFSVERIMGPDYVHTSDLFNTFMNTATSQAIIVEYPEVGEIFDFGTGKFTVLAPSGIHPDDSNNNSVVVRLENGSNAFLFTGDAEETSEQDMIGTGMNLDSDVLCLGHHGSASSTSWDLLEAVSPDYAVISCGTDNSYGHPSAEALGKLSDMEIPIFRTDIQGNIVALSDGTSLTFNTAPCNDYTPGGQSGPASTEITAPEPAADSVPQAEPAGGAVWLSATGEKYHSIPNCGRMNPAKARQVSESDAVAQGFGKCSKCF